MKKNNLRQGILLALAALSVAWQVPGLQESFEAVAVGKLPAEWSAVVGTWAVATDGANKVLYQTAKGRGSQFNRVVANRSAFQNGSVTVRLKAMAGSEDRGGGLMWRYRDANNYYVVRANPLEKNVVAYKVQQGRRTDLPLVGRGKTYGLSAPMASNRWHTLKVTAQGNLFTVFWDGKQLYQVRDDAFTAAGKVGLWSKADSQTMFDDLAVTP
ncbi:family 16 glycoside hydrolase [Hymenobacter lapidarius]|nr:hypothetical protein [Hymenobacter lapidarius]